MQQKNQITVKTPRGKSLSVPELAEILDVSNQRIHQLTREGMPVFERGHGKMGNTFSSYDAIWWYIEYEQKKRRGAAKENPDAPDTKQRIADTKMAMAELQLAERRGDLFHFKDWIPFIKDKLVVFRQVMAQVVENIRDRHGNNIAKDVEREIARGLNALSQGLENIPNEAKE